MWIRCRCSFTPKLNIVKYEIFIWIIIGKCSRNRRSILDEEYFGSDCRRLDGNLLFNMMVMVIIILLYCIYSNGSKSFVNIYVYTRIVVSSYSIGIYSQFGSTQSLHIEIDRTCIVNSIAGIPNAVLFRKGFFYVNCMVNSLRRILFHQPQIEDPAMEESMKSRLRPCT